MKAISTFAIAGAFGATMAMTAGAALAECSAGNYEGCKGKAWVDGDVMETPLGSKWWPHPIWGADDQAGSTNYYKQTEVVLRALAVIKKGETMEIGHEYHADMPLFDALRVWRKTRAEEEGVPAFVVFSDRTLAALAQARPPDIDGLFSVFGIGAAKRDRFGKAVLEVIAEFGSESEADLTIPSPGGRG